MLFFLCKVSVFTNSCDVTKSRLRCTTPPNASYAPSCRATAGSTPPPFQLPNLAASGAFLVELKMSAACRSGWDAVYPVLGLVGEGIAPQEVRSRIGTGLVPERFHIYSHSYRSQRW